MKRSQPLFVLLVLALAGGVAAVLMLNPPKVEPRNVETPAPLVRALTIAPQDLRLEVRSQGTVVPRTQTTLVAQVAGEVKALAPGLESGGFFHAGEVLVRLEARDYELAVQGAEARVAQAATELARWQAEAEATLEEWQEAAGDVEPSPLARREPQVAQARAALAAAEAQLEATRLDLERTRVRAPFSGRVRQRLANLGQYLVPGTPLATVHTTDAVEVRLPVPDDDLGALDLPLLFRGSERTPGPAVTLTADFAGKEARWSGRIVRSEGEVDPQTRLLYLVARVEDPYDASPDHPERPPLTVGLFVEARIEGRAIEHAVVIPRSALLDDDQVLVIDPQDRLRFRTVEVLRRRGDKVILGAGLEAGERICLTRPDPPIEGMTVRVREEPQAAKDPS